MRIDQVEAVDAALAEDVARLVAQLSPGTAPPTLDELEELAAAPGVRLLIARAGGRAAGMLTLVSYRAPTGLRARIEDVVVDDGARGQGLGRALTEEALRLAAAAGATTVELTSRPAREAANRLYAGLGFERRETNVYVWRPG